MRLLALDIGMRHTGVAFFDDQTGVVLPADTLESDTDDALVDLILAEVAKRRPDRIVVGHPLLPSGTSGEQAAHVEMLVGRLQEQGLDVVLFDERYSSPPGVKFGDAQAACTLLQTYLDRLLTKEENDIN
jgi:putative holliday junction resolvase